MSKLYQFTIIIIAILFLSGCPTKPHKEDQDTTAETNQPIAYSAVSEMSVDEQLNYAEKLFANAFSQSKNIKEKNTLLSNALILCTQILVDSHQAKLSHDANARTISEEQFDYTLSLTRKILAQFDTTQLTHKQKNQYQLSSAAISLSHYQAENTLLLLNQDFDSIDNEQWALYYQLRAMADFQLGLPSTAVKELIIRQGYLLSKQQKLGNMNLIWNYLASVELSTEDESPQYSTEGISKSDDIYAGWLKLAQILRGSKDPQTLNYAINFWLQRYPAHPAERSFINRIIQTRQASILKINHIAVLLPFQGKLAKPAKAIRDGILASHYQSSLSANIRLRFYDTSHEDYIWQTYQQAIDNGADFIIGPLAKSNLEVLAQATRLTIPTLALNSLEVIASSNAEKTKPLPSAANTIAEPAAAEESAQAPVQADNTDKQPIAAEKPALLRTDNLFQFGLSPEAAARMVAQKARMDGHFYAAVIAPDNNWGKRMQNAFTAYWEKSGGIVVDTVNYKSTDHDFSGAIKSMLNIDLSEARRREVSRTIGRKVEFTPRRRQDIDMLFMAAFPRQAKQIPLQVIYHHGETIPVYSTAHIVANYQNARQNLDMDGVIFADMPFLLGTVQGTASEQNIYQNTLYQRLFALGVDSYQLAPFVEYLYKNPAESFAGDTGKITINHDGHIVRSLPWASFKQGTVKLQSPSLNNDNAALY